MDRLNIFGLIFIVIIMIPNIIYAIKCKDGFINKWSNKTVEFLFSGIMSRSVLLIISAVIFAPCHITISYKNAE
jgi:hypothetical protein